MDFWRRHKSKVYDTLGVFGGGYILFKYYDTQRRRIAERANDELVNAQLRKQRQFDSVQRIADISELPHVMQCLRSRVAKKLDLSHLTERLMKGKGQPNRLTSSENHDQLQEELKILSFTRMVLSVWSMTMLSLYIRVQVKIVGRNLYIDNTRDSRLIDHTNRNYMINFRQYFATADFLTFHGLPSLISDMQAATTQVLKGKQLTYIFDATILLETITQILNTFMTTANPHRWMKYLMPQDTQFEAYFKIMDADFSDITKFRQLIGETRAVLSSTEFASVVDVSLKTVVDALMEDLKPKEIHDCLSGIPLDKLLPRVAEMGPILLEEPSKNRFVQIIRNINEVDVFFALLC